jgi:hypothetical protein
MSGSRDGERMLKPSNGTSMKSPRLSRITTGNPTHLTFKETEVQPTSDAQPLTLDGGNFSDLMELSLETSRIVKYLTFKEVLTVRIRISLFILLMEKSINSGILSILMNGRESHKKESSTIGSDSTLKEISM